MPPTPFWKLKACADFSGAPRIFGLEWRVTQTFSCGGQGGQRGKGTRGTGPHLKNMKIAVDCRGVATKFEPEGHKWPRHFLVGDMGARGRGQGALAPTPLWKIRTCADFSGVPRIFGLEGHT